MDCIDLLNIREDIISIKSLITNPNHWLQRQSISKNRDAFCLIGAICFLSSLRSSHRKVWKHLQSKLNKFEHLSDFNDAVSHEEVITFLNNEIDNISIIYQANFNPNHFIKIWKSDDRLWVSILIKEKVKVKKKEVELTYWSYPNYHPDLFYFSSIDSNSELYKELNSHPMFSFRTESENNFIRNLTKILKNGT